MQVFSNARNTKEDLSAAILVYGSFATVHDIKRQGNKLEIKPGCLATKEGIAAALRNLLTEGESTIGVIPDTLLAKGTGYMVWWVKPSVRNVWVRNEKVGGDRNASVPMPGLVMVTTADSWYVFAVKGKQRPDDDTQLYVAPFFNIWAGGKICTGSITVPQGIEAETPAAWDKAFFESYFTHPNVHEKNGLVKGSIFDFWLDLLDGKYARFPEPMLVKTGWTVKKALEIAIQGGGE